MGHILVRQPQWVVTLVHGTFARKAQWIKPTAYFSTQLKERLGHERIEVHGFSWSGMNSPRFRASAAAKLRKELVRQIEEYPSARHYVVAHSHGGAVALRAIYGQDPLGVSITGVATLATPFIHVRERGAKSIDFSNVLKWTWFLLLWCLVLGTVAGIESLVSLGDLGAVGMLLSPFLALSLASRMAAWLLDRAREVRESLTVQVPPEANMLIVRTSGDEASAFLAASHFLSWLVGGLWGLAYRFLRPMFGALNRRWKQIVAVALMLLSLLSYSLLSSMGLGNGASGDMEPVSIVCALFNDVIGAATKGDVVEVILLILLLNLVVFGVAYFCSILFLAFALLLVSFFTSAFGLESMLAAPIIELSTDAVPDGKWTVHQYGPTAAQGEGLALVHSAAYEDERVLDLVASWMREGVEEEEVGRMAVGA